MRPLTLPPAFTGFATSSTPATIKVDGVGNVTTDVMKVAGFPNNACPAQLMPLRYDFALKAKADALTPSGGTNQPIGIAWGWQSLTETAPLNVPAEDPNYTYKFSTVTSSSQIAAAFTSIGTSLSKLCVSK